MLKDKASGKIEDKVEVIKPLTPANVTVLNGLKPFTLQEGATLFSNRSANTVNALAPELVGLQAFSFDGEKQRKNGTEIVFETTEPVTMLTAYYRDDHIRFAKAPKLEVDASANEYGQAEPVLTNAIHLKDLALANVHAYHFAAGKHSILLPKGYISVLGFTNEEVKERNAALEGADEAVDWLFY